MSGLESFLSAQPAWGWVAIAALCLVAELSTGSGYLLWPAAAAGLLGVALFATPFGVPLQVLAFVALTVAFTVLGRRFLPRRLNAGDGPDVNDTAARLVGHEGETASAGPDPRVFVDGKEWAAAAEEGAALVPGGRVRVVAVLGGARLKVRPV